MQGGKPKLTKDVVKDDANVFWQTIKKNQTLKFSQIWNLYNDNNRTPHRSGLHAGHVAFPTYTASELPILCNICPDSLLYHNIVHDKALIYCYCQIYDFFLKKLKQREDLYWRDHNSAFWIDAFKVLLTGHYLEHNIYWRKLGQQEPYSRFMHILREIDNQEYFIKALKSNIVNANKPGSRFNNPSFAIAAQYFLDEILCNNQMRRIGQMPIYNFNMVFDALVVADINSKWASKQSKYQNHHFSNLKWHFFHNLASYQKLKKIANNNVFTICRNIETNNYNLLRNFVIKYRQINNQTPTYITPNGQSMNIR